MPHPSQASLITGFSGEIEIMPLPRNPETLSAALMASVTESWMSLGPSAHPAANTPWLSVFTGSILTCFSSIKPSLPTGTPSWSASCCVPADGFSDGHSTTISNSSLPISPSNVSSYLSCNPPLSSGFTSATRPRIKFTPTSCACW